MSKIKFMAYKEVVSRLSQTDFTYGKTTIGFKGDLTRSNILNIVDVGIDCLANGNPVTECKKKNVMNN